jgi:hypothetical protein
MLLLAGGRDMSAGRCTWSWSTVHVARSGDYIRFISDLRCLSLCKEQCIEWTVHALASGQSLALWAADAYGWCLACGCICPEMKGRLERDVRLLSHMHACNECYGEAGIKN